MARQDGAPVERSRFRSRSLTLAPLPARIPADVINAVMVKLTIVVVKVAMRCRETSEVTECQLVHFY